MKTLYSRETPKVLRGMRDKPNVTVGDVSPGFPHRRQQRYKKSYHQGWKAKGPAYNTEDLLPWKYSSGEESGTDYSAWGRTSSHDGGGYIAYLSSERQTTLEQLKSVKSNGWIDQLTRVVFLEFSTYN